jgi:hypothetical protein
MYYSKNNSSTVSVPRNYAGNAFRVVDETERKYIKEDFENFKNNDEKCDEIFEKSTKNSISKDDLPQKSDQKSPPLPSIFSDISVEDILLLGLIFVIHQENPNDSILILLLILLLSK